MINNGKFEELSINDYFTYDRMIAFLRAEVPQYANLTDYLDEGSPGIVKKIDEASTLAKSTVSWYADFINYLIAWVLPSDLTY